MFLEIGPGRGDFLFSLAEVYPDEPLAAIEFKRKRFDKLVRRLEEKKLPPVQLTLGDARVVLPRDFAAETCDRIFILFSDPWPKRRHAKHRLFQESFVKELARVLKPEGKLFIAHDDPQYVTEIQGLFRQFATTFRLSPEGVAFPTFYAEKWKKEGRTLHSFSYSKINCNGERDFLSLPCALPSDPS